MSHIGKFLETKHIVTQSTFVHAAEESINTISKLKWNMSHSATSHEFQEKTMSLRDPNAVIYKRKCESRLQNLSIYLIQ